MSLPEQPHANDAKLKDLIDKLEELEKLENAFTHLQIKRAEALKTIPVAKKTITEALTTQNAKTMSLNDSSVKIVPKHQHRKVTKKTALEAVTMVLGKDAADKVSAKATDIKKQHSSTSSTKKLRVVKVQELRNKKSHN